VVGGQQPSSSFSFSRSLVLLKTITDPAAQAAWEDLGTALLV